MESTVSDAIRDAWSKVLTLTHFTVLVAVIVYCSGGKLLLTITVYALMMCAVLLRLCFHLYRGYYSAREELSSIVVDNRDKQRLAFELEGVKNRNREYIKAIRTIKENLRCCLTLSIPVDPVVTAQGYVFERSGIAEHMEMPVGQIQFCPLTRQPMHQGDIHENYALRGVCSALHDLHNNLNPE
jgi:hypothetical protein